MVQILPMLNNHFLTKRTVIAQTYGVFSMQVKYVEEVEEFHFLMMENVMRLKDPTKLKYVFDLKGSLVNRLVKITPESKPSQTLKDQNFIDIIKTQPNLVALDPETRQNLIFTIRNDVNLFRGFGIMDYSLLLAIEECGEGRSLTPDYVHMFSNDRHVFHVSIIDYLQSWDLNKKSERFVKTQLLRKDGKTLSAIEPNEYATRFVDFVVGKCFK